MSADDWEKTLTGSLFPKGFRQTLRNNYNL